MEKELDGTAKRSHCGCMVFLIIMVLIIVATAFCYYKNIGGLKDRVQDWMKNSKSPVTSGTDEDLLTRLQQGWNQGSLLQEAGQPLSQEKITTELLESIYLNNIGTADWKSCTPPQKVNELWVLSSSEIREEDKPQWDILKGVDPVQFRKCVRKYKESHDMGDLKLWNDENENIQLNFFVNRSEYSDVEIMKNMQIAWNEEVLKLAKEHIFEPLVESNIGSDYQDDVRAKFKADAPDAIAELGKFVRFSDKEPTLVDYVVDGEKIEFDPPATPLSRQEVVDFLAKLPGEVCPEWIVEFSKLLDDRD